MHLSLLCLVPLLSAPPGRFGDPVVTHIAFRPDGAELTAAYYRHPTNRPGTNWETFAVT